MYIRNIRKGTLSALRHAFRVKERAFRYLNESPFILLGAIKSCTYQLERDMHENEVAKMRESLLALASYALLQVEKLDRISTETANPEM